MKHVSLCCASLLALLLTGVVFAQDPPQNQNTPQNPVVGKRQGRFMNARKLQQMDANSDGKIARDEWRGNPKGFDRLDANHDGVLTRDELPSITPGEQLKQRLSKMDSNGDGKIARDEWRGNTKAFDRMDRNGDGFLTADELAQRRGKIK